MAGPVVEAVAQGGLAVPARFREAALALRWYDDESRLRSGSGSWWRKPMYDAAHFAGIVLAGMIAGVLVCKAVEWVKREMEL